jgi:hypothetical protein
MDSFPVSAPAWKELGNTSHLHVEKAERTENQQLFSDPSEK